MAAHAGFYIQSDLEMRFHVSVKTNEGGTWIMYAFYGHLTAEEAHQAAKKGYVLVLPVGAIEQHGPHLPIDTDDYLAVRAAQEGVTEACEKYNAKVLYLPAVHYGSSFAHMGFPGRISLSFETFISVIFDILDQLVTEGFRRFVIVNGNGGNGPGLSIAMRKVTEKWRQQGARIFIYSVQVGDIADPVLPDDFASKIKELTPGNVGETHAGARETSWNLAGREELVRTDRLVKPATKSVRWVNLTLDDISDTGATGDPTQASREVGELYWKTLRTSFAKLLIEISQTNL